MSRYSKRHFRLVNPPADTPATVAWRLSDRAAGEQAYAEAKARFAPLTMAKVPEATAWMEARRAELIKENSGCP